MFKSRKKYIKDFNELQEKLAGETLTLPKAADVERSVLGACMINSDSVDKAVALIGYPDDENEYFYSPVHSQVWKAICTLHERGQVVDISTVYEETKKQKTKPTVYDQVEPQYLVELTGSVVSTANVEAHCRLILEKAITREMIMICEEGRLKGFADQDDVFELLEELQDRLFRINSIKHKHGVYSAKNVLKSVIDWLANLKKSPGSARGIMSGLNALDYITNGFQKGDSVIVAARPSQGKTALAVTIAGNAALPTAAMRELGETEKSVAFFSLEMSKDQIMLRLICARAEVNLHDLKRGDATEKDWERLRKAVKEVEEANLWIDDSSGLNPLEIRSKCRNIQTKHGLDLVIVDYLQLVEWHKPLDSREREIAAISRSLKSLAKDLGVPVVSLSQLNRGLESRKDPRPVLSDLRESGAIEQDSDVVIFVHRPKVYGKDKFPDGETTDGKAELIAAKMRNDKVGTARVFFKENHGKFDNINSEQIPLDEAQRRLVAMSSNGKEF